MAKSHTTFTCSACGYQSPKAYGRCPGCGQFSTMTEQVDMAASSHHKPRHHLMGVPPSLPQRLADVKADVGSRLKVSISEFNRVLGGGIVPGSLILLGGEPGIGKTTLLTQVAAEIANHAGTVLYVSGEESAMQIKLRAERLGVKADDLFLLTETNLENIFQHVSTIKPTVLIVDSIQTTYSHQIENSPGNPSQIRECAGQLQGLAKGTGISVFLVGHVTKEGSVAGPKLLEHLVDTVLYLEGDPFQVFRLLRGVKNRFGATSEVGVFEMQGQGMVEVKNPSEAFLSERSLRTPGSAIAVTVEGTRPLLVEIQALTSRSSIVNPRRTPNGVDASRMLLATAVLTRRCDLKLLDQDVFVNVVGGLKVDEPAADLAMSMAIASSYCDTPFPADMVMIGEVGLSGELRSVSQTDLRLIEAAKLGFKRALVPDTRRPLTGVPKELQLVKAHTLYDALKATLNTYR